MAPERINRLWDPDLIERYDLAGPRYTSYPTALAFSEAFNGEAFEQTLERSRASGVPLSLYLHIPFYAHLCYYCACNKIVTRKRDRAGPYLDRLHREIALRSIGLNRISLGVQDFNPKVQKAVNRVQPYEMVANRINTAISQAAGSYFQNHHDEGAWNLELDFGRTPPGACSSVPYASCSMPTPSRHRPGAIHGSSERRVRD